MCSVKSGLNPTKSNQENTLEAPGPRHSDPAVDQEWLLSRPVTGEAMAGAERPGTLGLGAQVSDPVPAAVAPLVVGSTSMTLTTLRLEAAGKPPPPDAPSSDQEGSFGSQGDDQPDWEREEPPPRRPLSAYLIFAQESVRITVTITLRHRGTDAPCVARS